MSSNLYVDKYLEGSDDLLDYKQAFDRNGSSKSLNHLKWMHFNNPTSRCLINLTYEKTNGLVAIYAVMPVFFRVGNKKILACQSLDTLTDLNHRGRGLFTKSAEKVYDKAQKEGYGFVYGFPNDQSVHGFTKKLEWRLLDSAPFLFKPLRSGYFVKKLLGKTVGKLINIKLSGKKQIRLSETESIKHLSHFSKDSTKLWEEFSKSINVCVERDSTYLNWRYFQKPDSKYVVAGFYENNTLLGFIVFVAKHKHGGFVGYIMELIVSPKAPRSGDYLIKYAMNYFIEQKVDVVLTWNLDHSPNFDLFMKNRFKRLQDKFRPIKLFFGYRNINMEESVLDKKSNWYLSYSDSDTV